MDEFAYSLLMDGNEHAFNDSTDLADLWLSGANEVELGVLQGNAAGIYVGHSGVSATAGAELKPGGVVSYRVALKFLRKMSYIGTASDRLTILVVG